MSDKTRFEPEIDKETWDAYLRVQRGGVTNMWNVSAVETLSYGECSREDAIYIIKHYGKLKEHFGYAAWD